MSELIPGRLTQIAPQVWRLIAPNPGLMTGPGTNTYLVGDGDGVVVIDPGPDDPAHVAAIATLTPGPVTAIVVTHTHRDHSPAAHSLALATGAPRMGRPAPETPENDRGFVAERILSDGEAITESAARLRVVATPGHASNHICLLLESTGMLFTGDHLMGGSTVVIAPPDGDMQAYLDSLARLLALPIEVIAPGHGPLIDDPRRLIEWTIEHRLERERKVLAAVANAGPAPIENLVPTVYGDVDARLHPIARHSLHAHLLKLERDGRVRRDAGDWLAAESP